MSVVFIVLPVALLLALAAVAAFVWSVRSGQMDDLETPGLRVLIEDDESAAPERSKRASKNTRGRSKSFDSEP